MADFWKRVRNIWELSQIELPQEEAAPLLFRKETEKAVFVEPNRAEEIFKNNKSIDDALV